MGITWQDAGPAPAWLPSHAYSGPAAFIVEVVIGDNDFVWFATNDGTSDSTEPDWAAADAIPLDVLDNDIQWTHLGPWFPGVESVPGIQVQPTVPNGRVYVALNEGTAGGIEPIWPTDGSTIEDGGALSVSGFSFDVIRMGPDSDLEFVSELPDALGKKVRIELDGTGYGSFDLSMHSPRATSEILAMGNLIQVRLPLSPDPLFAFFLETGDFDLVSRDEEGGVMLHFEGRGGLAYMERAVWLAESFVEPWWLGATPPIDADIGQIEVAAGTHVRYTLNAQNRIEFTDTFTTAGFTAFYDSRRSYYFTSVFRFGTSAHRVLVHLRTGPHAGEFLHIFDIGYTDHYRKVTLADRILLTDIGNGVTPGEVLFRLYEEATAAGRPINPLPVLQVDFDDTTDSDGNTWTTTDALMGLTAELGESYLSTIAKLIGTGVIDVEMGPDLMLHGYNHRGEDRTSATFVSTKVRFEKGVNIAGDLSRDFLPQPVATWAEILGTNDTVAHAELADAATRIPREMSLRAETDDVDALAVLGLAELERQLVQSEEASFGILALGRDPANGFYLPAPTEFALTGTLWPGDDVTLHTGTNEKDYNEASVRLGVIAIGEDEAGNLDLAVDLGSTGRHIGTNTTLPDVTTEGCDCPCDLGAPVIDTDPQLYYGAYGKYLVGTGTGSNETYPIPAQFVPGTLTVWSMPTGVILEAVDEDPQTGLFDTTAPVDDDVYASFRLDCPHGTVGCA